MIFVDSSVWIAAFRDSASREAKHLRRLLDDDKVVVAVPVLIEILAGASIQDRPRLRRLLSALPVIYPELATWRLMDRWLDPASAAGQHFGFADLLIGALAAQQEAPVWSLDSDFRRLAELGLVSLHAPVV